MTNQREDEMKYPFYDPRSGIIGGMLTGLIIISPIIIYIIWEILK